MNSFTYKSEQVHSFFKNGKGRTRRNLVDIRQGKGIKAVEVYGLEGNLVSRKEKELTKQELECISRNQFVPGLFRDCIEPLTVNGSASKSASKMPSRPSRSKKSATRRRRR